MGPIFKLIRFSSLSNFYLPRGEKDAGLWYAQWERQVIPMEWNIIVGLVCTVLGAVISYATFSHNKGKDDRSNGQQLGTVLTELGYIKSNTDEIKTEQREQRKTNTAVEGRLAAVEASAKSAHHRIDHLEAVRDEEH